MVRTALDVCDPLPAQLRLELRRAAPGGVLPALIGEDLPWRAILGNATRQCLQHQRASLVMRQRQAHQVARVIVQEGRDIHPLVSAQQKREQVRLPQLVRLSTLEAHELALRLRPHARARGQLAVLMQHSAHRCRRSSHTQKAPHHIPDATRAGLRLRRMRRQNRRIARVRQPRLAVLATLGRAQRRLAALAIALHPLHRCRVRHAQPRSRLCGAHLLLDHRPRQPDAHVQWPASSTRTRRSTHALVVLRSVLATHLSTPLLPPQQAVRKTSAR